MNTNEANVAEETAVRVARGYLNGTTRGQAYGLLSATAAAGAVVGVVGTVVFFRRKFIMVRKGYEYPVVNDPAGPQV